MTRAERSPLPHFSGRERPETCCLAPFTDDPEVVLSTASPCGRLLLVDNDNRVRAALVALLSALPGLEVVGNCGTALDALSQAAVARPRAQPAQRGRVVRCPGTGLPARLGMKLIGVEQTGAIINWLPLFLFVILFGLSMDYHVFILSRIREGFDRGRSTTDAIAHGIKSSAGVVTSAAIIMVFVFLTFVTLSLTSM
ncbi:MAG: hypothetical protein JWP76_3576, partial [Dactylosporangium sp.]|nr:hypothetical protein [Dactylosporangium sp.]